MFVQRKKTNKSGIKGFKFSYAKLAIIALIILACINTIRFISGNFQSNAGNLTIDQNAKPGNIKYISLTRPEYPYFKTQDPFAIRAAQISELSSGNLFNAFSENMIFAKVDPSLTWLDSGKQQESEKLLTNTALATGILNPLLLITPALQIPTNSKFSAEDSGRLIKFNNLTYDAHNKEATASMSISPALSAGNSQNTNEMSLISYNFNANDFGLNFIQIDKEKTYNIDYTASDIAEPAASFFSAAPCHANDLDSEQCNQMLFSIGSKKFIIKNYPAGIAFKLWNKMPDQGEEPVIKYNIQIEISDNL